MSAFLMPREALSNIAFEYLRQHDDGENMRWSRHRNIRRLSRCPYEERLEKIFQILLAENLRSLRARYGRSSEYDARRAIGWTVMEPSAAYRQQPVDTPSLIQLCDCYNYQASETRNYESTAAAAIAGMTRNAAIHLLIQEHAPAFAWGSPLEGFVENPAQPVSVM